MRSLKDFILLRPALPRRSRRRRRAEAFGEGGIRPTEAFGEGGIRPTEAFAQEGRTLTNEALKKRSWWRDLTDNCNSSL